jgi:hypothetical protein
MKTFLQFTLSTFPVFLLTTFLLFSLWNPTQALPITGSGNPGELQEYQFIDDRPILGLNYYRLKQIDLNPTKGTIHFTGIETGEIQIFNSIGSLIKVASIVKQEIDISDLSGGLYYLSFTDGNRVFSKRIVKH